MKRFNISVIILIAGLIAYAVYDVTHTEYPESSLYESGQPMSYAKSADYQLYVADIIWEKKEIRGGGAFTTDTVTHLVEDAYVDVWAKSPPNVDFFTNNAPAPGPGFRCTAIQKKRYWRE